MGPFNFDYDIFLSHAAADAAEADAVRDVLTGAGLKLYCDRHDDPLLDRSKVTRETAERLRAVMRRCNMLLYVVTESASKSRWMPWELGFFDGCRGRVLIYPVTEQAKVRAESQEYLQLFEILEPGSLLASVQQIAAPAHAFELRRDAPAGLEQIARMAKDAPLFGPADHAATAHFGQRMSRAAGDQSWKGLFSVQQEIMTAWLKLWGVR